MDDKEQQKNESGHDPSPNSPTDGGSNGKRATPSDGRIPAELREQILKHFASLDDRVYDNLDEDDLQELHQFLDLEELEREVGREQAKRQR
jgi:hypothetical protein